MPNNNHLTRPTISPNPKISAWKLIQYVTNDVYAIKTLWSKQKLKV